MTRCTSANPQTSFDYAKLPPEQAKTASDAAESIRTHGRLVFENTMAVGETLFNVKMALDHGQFGDWLEAEFGWSVRTAQRWITLWAEFHNDCDFVSYLPQTTLYALAAPSTPLSARERVMERLKSGEKVAPADIMGIIRSARKSSVKAGAIVQHDAEAEEAEPDEGADEAAEEAAALLRERFDDDIGTIIELLSRAGLERIIRHLGVTSTISR